MKHFKLVKWIIFILTIALFFIGYKTYADYDLMFITEKNWIDTHPKIDFDTVYEYYEEPVEYTPDEFEVNLLAKVAWGEARGLNRTEQSCIMWTILNRCDMWNQSIYYTVTEPNQFYYDEGFPTIDDYGFDTRDLARDVLTYHYYESIGRWDLSNRSLPKDYLWYIGDGEHNYFRTTFIGTGNWWDYSWYRYE